MSLHFHEKVCSKICIVQSYGTPVGKEALIPRLLITYKKLDRDGNEFTRNIESIKACYTSGEVNYNNITFMDAMEVKYKDFVEECKAEGKVPTHPSDKVIALKTKIDQLTQLIQKGKSKAGSDDSGKKKPKNKGKEWMTKPPASGKPKTKTMNNKKYHWCKGNGAHKPKWVIHKPKDCKGLGGDNSGGGAPVAVTPAPTPRVS
jgi:hypothetical protein